MQATGTAGGYDFYKILDWQILQTVSYTFYRGDNLFWFFNSALYQVIFLLSYISTSNSFPKPLSKKEEEIALEKFKNGDINARNLLVEKNLRLVAYIAKKYTAQNTDSDDLISIGVIGLIKAINTFNPDKGIRHATEATRCIENEILMVIRSQKKLANEVYLEEPIGVDKEGNIISFLDIVAVEDENIIDSVEINERIKIMLTAIETALDERERFVLINRYGLKNTQEKTQQEIADILKISRSYVSRIEKRAIKKLSSFFNE